MPLCILGALSPPTLCDPMDCSSPGCSVRGILQARMLEWVAISFPRGSSQPRDGTLVSHIAGRLFTIWATREVLIRELQISNRATHLLECLKSKHWQHYAGEDVEQHECVFTAYGNTKWYSHFGKILQQFHTELNLLLPHNPAVTFLGIYQMSWKLVHTKTWNKDVYRNLIHNCQHWEATKMFFSRWKEKQTGYIQTME